MTAAVIIDHLFTLLWESDIKQTISGKIRKFNRPTNSNREDITINILSVDFDQLQEGIANINLFVPNPKFNAMIEGKDVVLTDIPDQLRINKLLGDLKAILKHHYDAEKYILVELMEQYIMPEVNQTVVTNRLKVTVKNT
ncbi:MULTISPECIES: hypothetical protein [Sphingobacterium]|uniref:Uncharacterized protein n=1 Tax=Sphingobacterium tenebrionis TaxID=3111775 RepID=A0ABU8I403_9SPHI|nr:hypothetical protein [Sphingobacterium sp. CZ-2]QBR11483.1 hypothetical protein E3D81_04555 [Sphingobacterium sp. CZ-2]